MKLCSANIHTNYRNTNQKFQNRWLQISTQKKHFAEKQRRFQLRQCLFLPALGCGRQRGTICLSSIPGYIHYTVGNNLYIDCQTLHALYLIMYSIIETNYFALSQSVLVIHTHQLILLYLSNLAKESISCIILIFSNSGKHINA